MALRGLRRRLFPNAADRAEDDSAAEYLRAFHEQPDAIVRFIAWMVGVLHAALSLPRTLAVAAVRSTSLGRAGGGMYVNYVYALAWVGTLWALLLAGNWTRSSVLAAAAAAAGVIRSLEIAAWWLKLLFDRGHDLVASPERNVLFLLLDGLCLSFAIALLLRLDRPAAGAATHWIDALAIGTLTGAPGNVHAGPWTEFAVSGGTLVGLLLFVAGLALLVGLIADKFKEADRPYTGPMRPPFRAIRRSETDAARPNR